MVHRGLMTALVWMRNTLLCNTIPIRPGRNVAVICESAAITNRQKKMGTNTAKELEQRILASMQKSEE